MSGRVQLTIPAGKWLTSNASTNRHWRHRDGLARTWRDAACLIARGKPPVQSPFVVEATIHRANRQIHDLDGAVATVKAAIDGCRDAGLIAGDDTRHMVRLTVKHGEPDKERPRLVLTITHQPTPKESA